MVYRATAAGDSMTFLAKSCFCAMIPREQARHARVEEPRRARDESSEDEELVPSKRAASPPTHVLEDSPDDESFLRGVARVVVYPMWNRVTSVCGRRTPSLPERNDFKNQSRKPIRERHASQRKRRKSWSWTMESANSTMNTRSPPSPPVKILSRKQSSKRVTLSFSEDCFRSGLSWR